MHRPETMALLSPDITSVCTPHYCRHSFTQSLQCLQSPKCRDAYRLTPCRRWIPRPLHLDICHKSWQLILLDWYHLPERQQVLPRVYQDPLWPHEAKPVRPSLHYTPTHKYQDGHFPARPTNLSLRVTCQRIACIRSHEPSDQQILGLTNPDSDSQNSRSREKYFA